MTQNLTSRVVSKEVVNLVYVTKKGIVYDALFSLEMPRGIVGEYVPIVVV